MYRFNYRRGVEWLLLMLSLFLCPNVAKERGLSLSGAVAVFLFYEQDFFACVGSERALDRAGLAAMMAK